MNIEYDLRAFRNPDHSFAVRGKATALEAGVALTHRDAFKTPVFAEVEEATLDGPKSGQDFMEWALQFAKDHRYKDQLEALLQPQLGVLGLVKSDVKSVCAKVKL